MNCSLADEARRRLELALAAAREAGQSTLELFRSAGLCVERKDDGSPVTQADRAAEQLLRERIEAAFPHDGILGEEFGRQREGADFTWMLDPIDGTKSFITGVPLYTTLVAVMEGDDPLLGVIYAPATGEVAFAIRGGETLYATDNFQPTPARVRSTARLAEATFLTSEVASFVESRDPPARHVYEYFEQNCRLTRTWGDGYGYLLVATGRADVMIDPAMNLWDAAPLKPVIEGAGGSFTDWQGAATVHSGEAVATSPALAEQVLAITGKG